jgi:hypothetical protein
VETLVAVFPVCGFIFMEDLREIYALM